MKRLTFILLLFLALSLMLTACTADGEDSDNAEDMENMIKMSGTVLSIGDAVEINVTSDPYNSGIFYLIVDSNTKITANGVTVGKGDIPIGSEIDVYYSGQVMLSYPPQIYAVSITVK